MPTRNIKMGFGTTVVLLACCASVAHAFSDFWDANGVNPPNGIWATAANWVDDSTPTLSDTATFDIGGAYTVTFNTGLAGIEGLTVSSGDIDFISSGAVRTLNVTSASGGQDVVLDTGANLTLGTSVINPLNLIAGDDLSVQTGGALNILFSSDVDAADLMLSTGGQIIVDGSGSTLDVSNSVALGESGGVSTVTYRNSATGTWASLGTVNVGVSIDPFAAGVLNVESGAMLTAGSTTVGTESAGVGTINVKSSSIFRPVDMTINSTGTVNIIGGIFFTSGGNVTLNGGTLTRDSAGHFDSGGPATTFTIQNGGRASFDGSYTFQAGNYNITGTGSRLESSGNVSVINVDSVNVDAEALLSAAGTIDIGGVLSTSLAADGTGSSVVSTALMPSDWAYSGYDASVTFSNNATGTFEGGINLATGDTSFGVSTAVVDVLSGADLTVGNLSLAHNGASEHQAILTVSGTGSTVTLASGGTLTIGQNSPGASGSAVVHVESGAALTVGAGGSTSLNGTGTINIDGGMVDLQVLAQNEGSINFLAGSLSFIGDLTIGTGGLIGEDLTLTASRDLTVIGMIVVDTAHTLSLSGGALHCSNFVVNGALNFNSGTLGILPGDIINLGGTGIINTSNSISGSILGSSPPLTINVNASGVFLGDAGSFIGFNHQGILNVGANIVTLSSASYARLGILTMLAGGTINAPNGVTFASGSNFLGHGNVNARVSGESGSVIEADGALSLGDTASPAGFNFGGELRAKQYTVTLNSSAQAGLGNLTTLGSGSNPGTLNSTNGLVVDFTEAITGFGTINSTNTLAKRTIINGVAQGNSLAQPLTFSGYVKGVGTFNNVDFTGTFDPGLSTTMLLMRTCSVYRHR